MAEHKTLYERAVYYDVVFDRDVSREVDFLLGLYRRHTGRRAPGSVLDLACGPGYHAAAFARRGVPAVGLDLSPAMLQLAAEKVAGEDLPVTWLEADLRSFRLPRPADLAFIMFDGIDALLTDDDLLRHLDTLADNLSSGGLYVIDLTHPRECSYGHYTKFRYEGERKGLRVEIRWAVNDPQYDLVTGVAHAALEMHVWDHGKEILIQDEADERLLLPGEIRLLARLSGRWEVVAWHGDYDLAQPLDYSPRSRRMIAVLRKVR